jgi:hypothetical protein
MGYVLLWAENLTVALLLAALAVAGPRRWRPLGTYKVLSVVLVLVILLPYAGLTGLTGRLKFGLGLTTSWFYPLVALTVCYTLGAGWILVAGLRQGEAGLPGPRAAGWPRGKLAIALAVAFALHLMTLWNLDLAMRQRLGTLRAEAGALALSVAPPPVPDRDNAAVVYERAFQAMGDPAAWPTEYHEKWSKWLEPGAAGFDAKDPEMRAFLKRQAGALALLREGGDKPGCYFERDYGRPSIDMMLPELNRLREAARLLSLDARSQAADGNLRGGLADCRVMLTMAEHTSSDPLLISLLVSIAIDTMGMQALQAVLASAPPSIEDLNAVHLDGAFSYQRAFQRASRMEEAFGQTAFYDVGSGRWWVADLGNAGPESRLEYPPLGFPPLYRLFLLEDDQEAHRSLMKQCQRLAARPYFQAKAEWKGSDAWLKNASGMLTRLLFPALSHCAETVARAEAQRGLLQMGLAAYRFQADRARLPATVDELAPDFIPAVPQDPFDGKPLRMKRTARGLVLYSIGPDLTDNGGAPFDPNTRTGDITFSVVAHAAPRK